MTFAANLDNAESFAKSARCAGASPHASATARKKRLEGYKARLAIWFVGWLLLYALLDHIHPTVEEITTPPTSAILPK